VEDKREFIYRVDAHDRIVFANAEWYDFAGENAAMPLKAPAVIGFLLWDFISHPETKELFHDLLKKVRETGRPVTFPYRCDSADCRRFMELQILRLPNQEIEFRSRILREERRAPVRLMEDKVERTEELLIMCSWCKKVAMPAQRWVEVETAVNELHLFDAARLPRISHGICQACASHLLST
jgi:hypothetical protein